MKFDLASDLHNNFWPDNARIKWEGLGTSLVAVILGDINFDIDDTYRTVVEISKYYKYVIFVDGNHEHNNQTGIQERNYIMRTKFKKYQNIQYLNRNAIVIDGVAFVGANGWWTFDFMEPDIAREEAYAYFLNNNFYSEPFMYELYNEAMDDALILGEIVTRLTTDTAVKEIVMLTHTAPMQKFCDTMLPQHPANYARCGNSALIKVLDFDVNHKISTWCFGHVHNAFDETIDNIRYVSNPRGRMDDSPQNLFYYPKMIEIIN
jgi:Icc-related predicted phosphoesterase